MQGKLFYSIPAKTPAMITDVIVTVVKPPTIMGGNILLIRNSFSSGVLARAVQVASVMTALGYIERLFFPNIILMLND